MTSDRSTGSPDSAAEETGSADLLAAVARAVDAVPGVARREPSVGDFLRTLWKKPASAEDQAPDTRGLRLDQVDGKASLTVAVWVSRQAPGNPLMISQEVASRINHTLIERGVAPGSHQVIVREIE
ncbi:hypothetical protein AB0Y14_07515 [Rothia sp. HC945]|jgi:hypothetical protein|uniref:hypothetical protein n=1 Tax=Rothia sp. HC945 TaxID=3171170 RepID=UPI0026566841|nr:hypothetical protein [Kocuria sp.]MDN5618153.1 hypothetical protein [Kocuria sp.]MDN5654482.1 hypothetical protein [Kocuria sp.]